jgi:two-component system, LytTR family, response regulator
VSAAHLPRVRAVIVEDEPVARDALARMVSACDWIDVVGIAGDGEAGLALALKQRPELLLLDIQMPGMSGVALLERLPFEVGVIFTTAFDDHAVLAFELGALDYLRKPFGAPRLAKALDRARPQLERLAIERAAPAAALGPSSPAADGVTSARDRLTAVSAENSPLTRLFVRDRGRIIPVLVNDLIRCEAEDDYVALHFSGRRHLLYITLSELERRFDAARFLRVHRSHLINIGCIEAISPHDASRLAVKLTDGAQIVASRAGTTALRAVIR